MEHRVADSASRTLTEEVILLSERLINILVTSFPRILTQGILVTIPLTILAFPWRW